MKYRNAVIAAVASLLLALTPMVACADGGVSDGANPVNNPAPGYPFVMCDQTARVSNTGASAISIAHVAGKAIYICGYAFSANFTASTAGVAQFEWGTGTNCGTATLAGSAQLSATATFASTGPNSQVTFGNGVGAVDQSPVLGVSDFCLVTSGTVTVWGTVRFAQF